MLRIRMGLKLMLGLAKEKMMVMRRILIVTFDNHVKHFMCLGNAFAVINWILSAVNHNKAHICV